MEFTAKQIAQFVQGHIEGDENAIVNTFAKIEEGKKGAISFLSNPKYTHYVYDTQSSVVLIDESVELEKPVSTTLIRVKNAYECVAKLLQMYESMKPKKTGIDPLAFVSPKAKVAEGVYVGAFAYISDGAEVGEGSQIYPHAYIGEGVKVGKNALIYPNVTVYHGCKLGDNVTLHAGCVIGADGFGFAPGPDGYDKIPQIGIVTIEDDVEIGANTCVDRSTMGSTYIRKGVKLDNLVQIAHNTDIGENTVMSSQVGIAGSTATTPFKAEFIVDESCCWYACANSITFFARIITPTAPITAITSVFKFSSGCVTAEVPPAAKQVVLINITPITAPDNAGTNFFLN